jgi:flavin-dependent dehydrogenase
MGEPAAYDVAIAGGGPAGAACATLCAEAGLRTLVLEKSVFPRDKVCGDCLNPGCWPVLEQLGVAEQVLAAPHSRIVSVAFAGAAGRRVALPIDAGEIAITRRVLDAILLRRSAEAGAEICQDRTLRALSRQAGGPWRIEAGDRIFAARRLVAADGRNSTVSRLLGVAPAARRDRVGLQAHVPASACQVGRAGPAGLASGIELHLLPEGYCGVAPVGDGVTNFCLVATADRLDALKAAVSERFAIAAGQDWRAIAPLERAPVGPLLDGVVYIGDAARVVEPFTGEGIYYALHSARLAAAHIVSGSLDQYPAAHAALYRRRLWINRLARWAVTHPRAGAILLDAMSAHPASLRYLVQRVTRGQPAAIATA